MSGYYLEYNQLIKSKNTYILLCQNIDRSDQIKKNRLIDMICKIGKVSILIISLHIIELIIYWVNVKSNSWA